MSTVPTNIPANGAYIPGSVIDLNEEQWNSINDADPPVHGSILQIARRAGHADVYSLLKEMEENSWLEAKLVEGDDVRVINALKKAYNGAPVGTEILALFNNGDITVDAMGDLLFHRTEESESEDDDVVAMLDEHLPEDFTAEQRQDLVQLFNLIEEVNGQDAYSVTAMALGRLKSDEFLVLPENLRGVDFSMPASDVGSAWDKATSKVTNLDLVNIYALNKAVGSETKDPVFFAVVRTEAVKMGWFNGQAEVRYASPPQDAFSTFHKDKREIADALESARTSAFLIPFMNEYVFRTTGHHFLTGLIDDYDRKYQSLCSACLAPDLTRKLRSAELWHKAMHWVSPERTRAVIEAQSDTARLPHAISLRKDAAPAGTAIVTTTCAVIEALESCNWANEVERAGNFDFQLIKDATKRIKDDVTKYHTAYFAYGVAGPSAAEKAFLETAVTEAQKFAPVAQGFVDAMYTDSSLGRAKALRKHADASPVLMRRATRVFRVLARTDTEEIADIFKSTTATKPAAKPAPTATQTTPP